MLPQVGTRELWNYRSDGSISTLTGQIRVVKRPFRVLPSMGMQEWWKYYLDGEASTPTYKILKAEHRSVMLLAIT